MYTYDYGSCHRMYHDNQKAKRAPTKQIVRTIVASLKELGSIMASSKPPTVIPKAVGRTLIERE